MDQEIYRRKVAGGWLGKAIGGTLGQVLEGSDGPHSLTFYDPVPTSSIPNDDLDLQVLWACRLAAMEKPVISYALFEKCWRETVPYPCDEYGMAIRNLKNGVPAPLSGSYDNYFTDGLGAAIRSELWAFLAPGEPEKAVRYATVDGSVDHCGNGLYAQQFMAALESMAFVESDFRRLLECGLAVIPADCRLAAAVRSVMKWTQETQDFRELDSRILRDFGCDNFTDVTMNFAFMTAALLTGEGDFGKSVCTAVNFGRDADCTGATVGALMGIVDPDGIPEKWRRPIGDELVVCPDFVEANTPKTLSAFSEMVAGLRDRVVCEGPRPAENVDLSRFAIKFTTGISAPWFGQDAGRFLVELPAKEQCETFVAPGHFFILPETMLPHDAMRVFETGFTLPEKQKVSVMVNTRAHSLVWVDGTYLFGREAGGRMAPSFHRAPLNQIAKVTLDAGKHRLRFALALDENRADVPVVFGIGDAATGQWLPGVFRD